MTSSTTTILAYSESKRGISDFIRFDRREGLSRDEIIFERELTAYFLRLFKLRLREKTNNMGQTKSSPHFSVEVLQAKATYGIKHIKHGFGGSIGEYIRYRRVVDG